MGFINPGKDSYGQIRGQKRSKPQKLGFGIGLSQPFTSQLATKRPKLRHRPLTPRPTLESLPTELIQTIFLAALNPSLAVTCSKFSKVLTGRYLQLRYLHILRHDPKDLTHRIFTTRFFTTAFLHDYERHFSTRLNATGTYIPLRLLGSWDVELIVGLSQRGAHWNPEQNDIVLESLHDGLRAGRKNYIAALLLDLGVSVDTKCLRLAVEGGCGEELLEVMVARGADIRDLCVWTAALERGDEVVEWLLARTAPPGDALREVIARRLMYRKEIT